MSNLQNQFIKDSYQNLLQITSSNAVEKGDGTSVTTLAITSSTTTGVAPAIVGNANDRILTATGGQTINAESNLTFDGNDLTLGAGSINLPVNGYIVGGDTAILNGNHVLTPANPPAQPNDVLAGTSSLFVRNTQIQLRSISEPNVIGGYESGSIFFKTPSGSGMTYTNEGRLGIGISNPTSILHVSGANNQVLFEIDSPAVNNIIYVSGSGNVGIGTTTPGVTLDVSGNIRSNGVVFSSTTQTQNITINSAAQLQFRNTSSVEVGRFDNAGNWGIGTTTPTAKLHVSGASNAGLFEIDSPAVNNILFVSGSGNVGVGTGTPQRRLHIDASGSANTSIPLLLTSVDSSNRVGILFASSSLSAGRQHSLLNRVNTPTVEWLLGTNAGETALWNFIPRDDTNYAITLRTPYNGGTAQITTGLSQSLFSLGAGGAANQHLNISSSGNVGIGTNLPSAYLHISGASADSLLRVGSPSNANILFVSGSGNIGIGTLNPLSRLHVSASSGNEFLRITSGSQNILNIRSGSAVFFAGTGVAPTVNFDLDVQGTGTVNGGSVRFAGNSTVWNFASTSTVTRGATGNTSMFDVSMTGTATALIQNPMSVTFTANQNATSGSGYTVFRVNATHATTAGTGSKLLQSWEFGGTQRSVVNITGSIGVGITAPSASVHISSSLGLAPILAITPHHPLPTTNIPTGSFMVSASVPPRPFMWDGTSWYAL